MGQGLGVPMLPPEKPVNTVVMYHNLNYIGKSGDLFDIDLDKPCRGPPTIHKPIVNNKVVHRKNDKS